MASRLGKYLRAKPKVKNFGLLAIYHYYLFVCSLTAPWLTFGYYWESSPCPDVNYCIWAINFCPKVARRGWVSTCNWVPSGLWSQWHNPLNHSPQIAENTLPTLEPSFSEMWKCPQYSQNSNSLKLWWSLGLHNTSLDAKFSVQNFNFCWSIKLMS